MDYIKGWVSGLYKGTGYVDYIKGRVSGVDYG